MTMAGKSIKIIQGDITESEAAAIVNAANNRLWMGSGVAGAIKRKGGQIIEDEAVKMGPIPVGEAVATTAGSLPHRYVIHAAAMGQDLTTDSDKIKNATHNSLLRAEELKIDSVCFPALGTGVGGYSTTDAAKIMIDVVKNFLSTSVKVTLVSFMLFDQSAYDDFVSELGSDYLEL
jgi:O-acetyl-ADP-ribose deacetylase (regulator of RNase III)